MSNLVNTALNITLTLAWDPQTKELVREGRKPPGRTTQSEETCEETVHKEA